MSLRKSPRKPDKPSFNGSPKDVLYGQLLSSLTGKEGIASESECIAWACEEFRAGRKPILLDPRAPYKIQRGQAHLLLQAFVWNSYRDGAEVLAEAETIGADGCQESPTPRPVDEDRLYAEFSHWRSTLIERYHLPKSNVPGMPPNL